MPAERHTGLRHGRIDCAQVANTLRTARSGADSLSEPIKNI